MTEPSTDRYVINSVLRACAILRLLAKDGEALRLGKIASALDIDRTTAYRIVVTLEQAGFLERKPDTKEYKLGVGAFEVGSAYQRSTDLHSVARPIMVELSRQVQESVHWAILSGDKAVCIDRIESPRGLGTTSKIGRASALNAGSVGKVLLAFQNDEVQEGLLKNSTLNRFTEKTITSVEHMREEIAGIRTRGHCVSMGEGEEDMACIAAPIFNHARQIVAGLSVGGPIHRFAEEDFKIQTIAEVKRAARQISEKLGCPEMPDKQNAA